MAKVVLRPNVDKCQRVWVCAVNGQGKCKRAQKLQAALQAVANARAHRSGGQNVRRQAAASSEKHLAGACRVRRGLMALRPH